MKTLYFRPDMPRIESGLIMSRLYEWFGEQDDIVIKMNASTFSQILTRLNINPDNRIMVFNEPEYMFGYRILLDETIPDFYVNIFDFYEVFG